MKNNKRTSAKAGGVNTGWKQEAPTVSFAGQAQPDFEARIRAYLALFDARKALQAALRGNSKDIVTSDKQLRDTIQAVVAAVRGDPGYGSDSALLAEMGYIPTSQRSSGKTNKSSNGNGTTTPTPNS